MLEKNNNGLKNKVLRPYVAPMLTIDLVDMEEGFAAASGNVLPGNAGPGTVEHEWEDGTTVTQEFEWK